MAGPVQIACLLDGGDMVVLSIAGAETKSTRSKKNRPPSENESGGPDIAATELGGDDDGKA